MRENGPESPPEGHGRVPRADLQYLRASIDRQGVSGLGLEAQREAIDRHIRAARRKAAVRAHGGRVGQKQRPTTTTALSFGSAGSKSGSVRPSASRAVWGSRRERLGEAQARAGRSFRAIAGITGAGRQGQRPAGSPRPLGSLRRPKRYGRPGRASWVVGGPENCLLLLRSTGWMRRRREMMPGGETPTSRRGRISGREMRARRKTSAATLRKRGGGVSESRRGSLCNLDMVSCADFFFPFDFQVRTIPGINP